METSELLKKVRKIEIKTRGLTKNIFAGEYHSAFKGRGMTFSEVREYQYGDSIRDIDWNVTARFNKPFVKIFEEERELTVMLLVDVSASRNFGTQMQFKKDLIAEISAVLSFSTIQNNDKIGLLLFSDRVEKYIPPQKGRTHGLRIIRELLEFEPTHKGTNIEGALQYFTNMIKRKCTAFLISDFLTDNNLKDALSIANKKHDLIALKIYDKRETEIPAIGLVRFRDMETEKEIWVDTSIPKIRKTIQNNINTRNERINDSFIKSGVDFTSIPTEGDYVRPLMNLFKKRG